MGFFSCILKPLAYLSLPAIILGSLSAASPKGQYYTRIIVYLGTVAGVATVSIVTATTLAILGRPHDVNYYVAYIFYGLVSRLLDIRVEVEGQEHLENRPAIIMGNHQSMLDLIILGKVIPKGTSMLAKKQLRFTPVGPFMMLSGAIFIDRGNNERAIRSLKAATDLMKRLNISIWMFPEGTRHLGPDVDMLPFKKGGFHMAIQAGLPIIPIVTQNYWHIYHEGVLGTGVIKARVLPPIPTEGLNPADINDLMARVRGQMLEALSEISIQARKPISTDETKGASPSTQQSEKEHVFLGSSIAINPPLPTTETNLDSLHGPKGSSASVSSSTTSSQFGVSTTGSEAGGETEEDEGMVLVDRPNRR